MRLPIRFDRGIVQRRSTADRAILMVRQLMICLRKVNHQARVACGRRLRRVGSRSYRPRREALLRVFSNDISFPDGYSRNMTAIQMCVIYDK